MPTSRSSARPPTWTSPSGSRARPGPTSSCSTCSTSIATRSASCSGSSRTSAWSSSAAIRAPTAGAAAAARSPTSRRTRRSRSSARRCCASPAGSPRITMAERLDEYAAKRDFAATPEPAGGDERAGGAGALPRFVIQEHSATRLHWDLRLEHDGALASWAIPNGLPWAAKDNRVAVHTEDHPLEYLEFHGEIPKGSYGAGTMTIWDRGTYEVLKWADDKVEIALHGERVTGGYALFPIGPDPKDWMIHRMGEPAAGGGWVLGHEPMPTQLVPMLAKAGPVPPAREDDQ